MIRIIGFIVGSFLSVSALVLLFGIPEFHRGTDEADRARMDAAIENMKRKWEQAEAPGAPPAAVDLPAEADGMLAAAAAAMPVAAEPDARQGDDQTAPVRVATPPLPAAAPPGPEWRVVWTPFRTEIAARGFVSRLESVTGLDYRVAKLGTGVYQVAFAYRDEAELDAGLAEITAATGLDLTADRR